MNKGLFEYIKQTNVFKKKKETLDTKIKWLKDLHETNRLYFSPHSCSLIPPVRSSGYKGSPVPDFLDYIVTAKVVRIIATLCLFQGKTRESLELLASLYLWGESLNSHGVLIQRMIGMAIRNIATEGLEIYVLNVCETKEEIKEVQNILQRLHNIPGKEKGAFLFEELLPFLYPFMKKVSAASVSPFPVNNEAITRHKVADARFQLLRMALAAKYHRAQTGEFPSSHQQILPFFPAESIKDPFTVNDPILIRKESHDELIIYSVGPDKTDDKATFSYDPTNGTVTAGDILITIPKERKFPFPRERVRAANAFELLEQFPNGLPLDLYSNKKGRPLSIIESTKTDPLVIFSFGPDSDEKDFYPYKKSVDGKDKPSFIPVPTPDPGPHPPRSRILQNIMRRSNKIPSPHGYWTLEPFYDPTNGTLSNGDLFIEIPR